MASDFVSAGRNAWNLAVGSHVRAGLLAASVIAAGPALVAAFDGNPTTDDAFATLPVPNASTGNAASAPTPAPASDAATKPKTTKRASERDKRVSLNFKSASWSKVLKRVAKHGGLTLVMKRTPPGHFTRNDLNQYTVAEAIWIMNRDLEPTGYRVIRQGDFLMVMDLDALRSDYRPSVARNFSHEGDPDSPTGVRPVSATESAPETPQEKAAAEAADAANEEIAKKQVRLVYISTPWSTVLPRFAEQAGLILVMKRCPAGTFQHPEWGKHTVPEAIEIMNKELDDTNFRLIRQDKFLIVLYTEDLRTEYERPIVGQRRIHVPQADDTPLSPAPSRTRSGVRQVANEEVWSSESAGNIPAALDAPRGSADPETGPMLLDAAAADSAPARFASRVTPAKPAEPQRLDSTDESSASVESAVFVPQHGRASVVAQQMYQALRYRSELITPGLQGLPSFRVFEASSHNKKSAEKSDSATSFTVGFDAEHNRLLIEARPRHLNAVLHLCNRLDAHSDGAGLPIELVSADAETCAVAKSLSPELDRILAQRGPVDAFAQAGPTSSGNQNGANQSGNQPTTGQIQLGQPGATNQKGISEIIKGLKGDVTVESVPELGILILRGGQSDVEAVMKVIREIERLSAVATPQIHLLPLQYVNSESFATLVNEVYRALSTSRTAEGAGKSLIQVFPLAKPNAVLVLAPEADMPAVIKLATQLDQPVNPDLEFQVFQIKHGYAAQVARSVTEFYKSPKGLGTSVNVFADARTNTLIVQARPRDLTEVGRLIERLDGPTASQATIKVFPLSNGDATSIQRLLETLFGTAQRPGAQSQQQGQQQQQQGAEGSDGQAPTALRLSVDARTNSIIALGPPDTLRAVEAIIIRLDNSDVHQRETTVIRLKNNASDNVARAITEFVRSQRELQQIDPEALSSVELLEREVFVVSEPVSNTLLLSATPRYFAQLKQMIEKLDAPPAQVIIQALLVEVELDNTDEFGIEMGFQSPVLFDRSTIGNLTLLPTITSQNPESTVSNNVLLSSQATPGFQFGDPSSGLGQNPAINQGTVGSQELTSLGVGRTSSAVPGVSGLVLAASSESVSALLRALSYKRTIHVLSRPQIRTLDNRLASIQVGQRVPIIQSAIVNSLGNLQPLIQYDNAGIILTVQPRITPDGMIALEAYAEKSQYETTGVTIISQVGGPSLTSPIKDITRAEASVNVASGNTVVMGGMITSNDQLTTTKVPWLGDVPIIGQAFRFDSKTTKRTELLIFLTPRVIRDDADDEMIKQVETERIHFLVEEAEAMHGPILSTRPPALEECPPEGMLVSPMMTPTSPLSTPSEMAPPSSVPAGSLPLPPAPLTPSTVPTPPPIGPATTPGTPNAPGGMLPQRAPVLPPPAMPPVGSRPTYDLPVPLSGTPGTATGWPQTSAGPQPCAPVGRPANQSQSADAPGAVRAVSFETPAWENAK
jgi:type II secretion system protein D